MDYSQYDIQTTQDNTIFSFVSMGPKGDIQLFVLFQVLDEALLKYNLVLGPLNSNNEIDDLAIVANGDRNKILATVATCVFIFLEKYQSALVYFTGSTPARTRLYQRAINLNIEQLQKELVIFGISDENRQELYLQGKNYSGFQVVKKEYI